jgi:hypothetical protein
VRTYVKNNKAFPTDLWEEIKSNHPKTFKIDQSVIDLMMFACAQAGDLRHGIAIMDELGKLKKGKKHITAEMRLAGYNALLHQCETRMNSDIEAGENKDTGMIMEVLDEVNNQGLQPNDDTIMFLRRNM